MLIKTPFLCVLVCVQWVYERCVCERCWTQRLDFRADLKVLTEEPFCSSDGGLFRRIKAWLRTGDLRRFFSKSNMVRFFHAYKRSEVTCSRKFRSCNIFWVGSVVHVTERGQSLRASLLRARKKT